MLRLVATEELSEHRHSRLSRAADEERPNPGEYLTPDKQRHADLRDAEDGVVAGNSARNGKGGDDGAEHWA